MIRAQLEKDYRVVHGVIVSPGKFEACPVYAPYFWHLLLEGSGDTEFDVEGDYGITWFNIEKEDLAEFPELAEFRRVGVWEDGNGFVYCAHEIPTGKASNS